MYLQHFGLTRFPFTIAPDPAFLYPSPAHEEALAHLQYSLTGHGGLICLTGEVGTGKTTLCRAFLSQAPAHVRTAYLFNPHLSALELLQALCDELGIPYQPDDSHKRLYDAINQQLLYWYAQGERVIVVIDEAQAMPPPLLEQIRLLTNLETDQAKLLTLILVGQPELRTMLQQHNLRQLNQRITARYHLPSLKAHQALAYLDHRMQAAGGQPGCFSHRAARALWRASHGVPRLLNALADRALLGAYAHSKSNVGMAQVRGAKSEILSLAQRSPTPWMIGLVCFVGLLLMVWANLSWRLPEAPTVDVVDAAPETPAAITDPVVRLSHAQSLPLQQCHELPAIGWQCLWVDWPLSELRLLSSAMLVRGVNGGWHSIEDLGQTPYGGQALILWQPPKGYDGLLRPGQRGELVPWLRRQFGMTWGEQWQTISPQGQNKALPELLYDPLLANRVAQFQASRGLNADRIVGPRTLLALQGMEP